MSFNIALSGLRAAQKDLDVTANNIANVNTYGFKESRAEFADVFSTSLFSNSKTQNGEGVLTNDVAQQFHQGSLLFTSNALDMAISGNGFFVMTDDLNSRDFQYSRAGAFKLDKNNRIVTSNGNFLQGFPVNEDGSSSSVSLSTTAPIQIPDSAGAPKSTAQIDMSFNLQEDADTELGYDFDPNDTSTYTAATSTVIYDSLGNNRIASVYYVKVGSPDAAHAAAIAQGAGTSGFYDGSGTTIGVPGSTNTSSWLMFATVTDDAGNAQPIDLREISGGNANAGAQTFRTNSNQYGMLLQFDSSGAPDPATLPTPQSERLGAPLTPPVAPDLPPYDGASVITGGANKEQKFSIKLGELTQFSSPFEITSLSQDGQTVGRLTGITIGNDGLIQAKYSNGDSQAISKLALVRFANEQGLTQIGNTSWIESQDSGEPLAGEPDTGTFGSIRSGTLEQANVNLTGELVDLITAQRNYQANSRALEVNNQISQTILQIR